MTTEQLAKDLLAIIDSEMYVNDFGGLQAGRDATTDIHAAMGNLQASFAQPEQEPVAWMYTSEWKDNEQFITRYQSELTTYKADEVWPLYKSPPKRLWVGLTEEEVRRVAWRAQHHTWDTLVALLRSARQYYGMAGPASDRAPFPHFGGYRPVFFVLPDGNA